MKRRAISNVVSTAIMLTAVAVMGTGVVLWSNTNLKTYENGLLSSASVNTNKINEIPKIENIAFVPFINNNPGIEYLNVTVTNVGTAGFNVTQITISDSTQHPPSLKITNGGIPSQSSQMFSTQYQWINGYPVTVQVTTARGTSISTQAVQP